MAEIHDTILTHGIDAARAMSFTKAERSVADAAFTVMTDESQRIGIMHAGFAMTALPHKQTDENVWERQSGDVKLLLESGGTSATDAIGLPYGSIARMILLYLQTEAVKTRSREVELGRSMNTWLNSMGTEIKPAGPFYYAEGYHQQYLERRTRTATAALAVPGSRAPSDFPVRRRAVAVVDSSRPGRVRRASPLLGTSAPRHEPGHRWFIHFHPVVWLAAVPLMIWVYLSVFRGGFWRTGVRLPACSRRTTSWPSVAVMGAHSSTNASANVSHTYANVGSYTVSLTAYGTRRGERG